MSKITDTNTVNTDTKEIVEGWLGVILDGYPWGFSIPSYPVFRQQEWYIEAGVKHGKVVGGKLKNHQRLFELILRNAENLIAQ